MLELFRVQVTIQLRSTNEPIVFFLKVIEVRLRDKFRREKALFSLSAAEKSKNHIKE